MNPGDLARKIIYCVYCTYGVFVSLWVMCMQKTNDKITSDERLLNMNSGEYGLNAE